MKLKFDPNLDYQDEAISAVIDLFQGQPVAKQLFTVSAGAHIPKLDSVHGTAGHGVGNKLIISEDEILQNLNEVQLHNGLPQTRDLHGTLDFKIEMETGTGKTYVYLKTILELNKNYGFTKFIIVVPSLAIKEGVYKTYQITKDHFACSFNPYDCFVYNSDKMQDIRNFALDDIISIMIINIDAFRKSFEDEGDLSKKSNIIHRPSEKLNGMKPIELIRETNPMVIIDEPQSVDTTENSAKAIASLNPLCIFRYSATLPDKTNLIYRLDAVDAHEKGLVKSIDVAGFSSADQHNSAYIRLVSVDNKKSPITARIEVDAQGKDRIDVIRKTIKVKKGDDLVQKTKRDVYEGYNVDEIYCEEGNEYIGFTPCDEIIRLNASIGDVDDLIIKRKMISKTIQEHLDKEVEYRKDGIKVLSLFFIDRVDKYRNGGIYAQVFEEEYARIIRAPKYASLLDGADPKDHAHTAHGGYFSGDRKSAGTQDGKWKDSSGKTADDNEMYEVIMKGKERLLSFDEKLRFIFSHSALREGWDNPNVFQICTLKESKSEVSRRQEIGRGLRLCVDQEGNRIHDPYKNVLTVMASESYDEFASSLQNEYEKESGIRFGVIENHTFANIVVRDPDTKQSVYLGQEKSEMIYNHFREKGYIDQRGKVQDKLKEDLSKKVLDVPEDVSEDMDVIMSVCYRICGKLHVRNNDDKRKVTLNKEVCPEDFNDLWERIKYRTKYNLHFDSDELIRMCIRELDEGLQVRPPKLLYNKAKVNIDAAGVSTDAQLAEVVGNLEVDPEDLPDIITYLQNRTDLTRRTVVSILTGCSKLDDFKKNPQMFMEQTARIITKNVRMMARNGITYVKLGDSEYYAQELFNDKEMFGYIDRNMIKTNRSLYEYTTYDSDVEKSFVLELEKDDHVRLFFKLPDWFRISTPIGPYNPDWAVLMNFNGDERLYFVFETKGNIDNNRPTEEFKIHCGKKHFEALGTKVEYMPITTLNDLVLEGESRFE